MRINKLFGALAVSGICAAGMAFAAVNASDASVPATQADGDESMAVTATWAMGNPGSDGKGIHTGIPASYSVDGVFSSSDVVYAGNVVTKGIRETKDADKNVLTVYTVYGGVPQTTVDENSYVEFQLKVRKPVKVSNVSLDMMGRSSGNGKYDVSLLVDGKETSISTNQAPVKWNSTPADADTDFSRTFSIPSGIDVATESISLRFYLYAKDTTVREFGFANVVISGTAYENGGEDPEPAENVATVTWPLGVATVDEISSTSSMDVFETSFVKGSDIGSTRSKNVFAKDGNGWDCTEFQIKNRSTAEEKGKVFDNEYVEFVVTPKTGKFMPTHLSFYAMMDGFGDGHIRVTVTADGVTKQLTSDYNKNSTPKLYRPASERDSVNKADCKWEKDIAGLVATDGPIVVRLEMWNANTGNGKYIGLADVTITGEYFAEGSEAPEFPEGWAVIPGTLNKIEEATDKTDAGWSIGGSIKYDNQDGQFGSIKNGGWCSTNFFCDKAGVYDMVVPFKWAQNNGQNDDIHIQITDQTTGKVEIDQHFNFVGEKIDQIIPLEGAMTRGRKTIKFTFTSPGTGYITNIMAPTFNWVAEEYDSNKTPSGYLEMPGTLTLASAYWTEDGLRIENADSDKPNFGWASEGKSATAKVFCKEAGVYSANIDLYGYYAQGDMILELTDEATGTMEARTVHHVDAQGPVDITLGGKITTGKKALKILFQNVGGNFCANFYAPVVTKVADEFAQISNVTVEGVANSAAEGYDWNFLLPEAYAAESLVLNIAAENGAVKANGEDVVDGKVTIATPAPNRETIVNLELAANEGAYAAKTAYAVRVFRIGGVEVAALTVDGHDVTTAELLAALNSEAAAATLAGNCYTAIPAVSATMLDGSIATATVTLDGTTATATFTGKTGDKTKTFTLAIEGVHTYSATESDKFVKLVYDSAQNNKEDKSWSDGLYTVRNTDDGWHGTQFKFKPGENKLEVPSNVIVKQIVFAQLGNNYTNGNVTNVISEGADNVWVPTHSEIYCTYAGSGGDASKFYNLVVNIEGHKIGTPISFTLEGGGQPVAWIELLVEEYEYDDAPSLMSKHTFALEGKNHMIVELTFDRPMLTSEGVYGDGHIVRADGGSTTLRFPLWNLPWGETTTLTIPAAKIQGVSGLAMENDIVCSIEVSEKPAVAPVASEKFVVVSDVAELRAAVEAANASNTSADAERIVIFAKSGDYDLGSQPLEFKGHNVSLIGESRSDVVIHGNRTGIIEPVFSTANAHDTHLENFTLRNDLDFGKARVGVGVAFSGGVNDVLVNVTLQSQQDTQVTGESGYYLNCEIYGCADFICGGGNHYFDHCTLVLTSDSGIITAPGTSQGCKYGYVFEGCRIVGGNNYVLARPWQGEPRAYWLNTIMESQSATQVWGTMTPLPTHFYEYNTMDAMGYPFDLSDRQNSTDSQNKYTPVLTDEEAAEFTIENVLGHVDSWLATEELGVNVNAPENVEWNTKEGNNYIWWIHAEDVAGYMIFDNGRYVGYASGDCNHFDLNTNTGFARKVMAREEASHSYTVHSVTAKGSLSAPSMAMTPEMPTGVATVAADEAAEVIYYNLQGQPVAPGYRGAAIKVEVKADGTTAVSKAMLK